VAELPVVGSLPQLAIASDAASANPTRPNADNLQAILVITVLLVPMVEEIRQQEEDRRAVSVRLGDC
jgi:hypothetical protein